MQMFGIGVPELMVIFILAILVVGPDRLPGFAADLARWIRQARVYANHMMKDFNEVAAELQKEAGTTTEDWKEIASVVGLHTADISRELQRVTGEVSSATTTAQSAGGAGNVVPFDAAARQTNEPPPMADVPPETDVASDVDGTAPTAEETPWYVPDRTARRRPTE